MKLFLSFVKIKLHGICCVCICIILFAGIGALYSLPLEAIIYASALSLFFAAFIFAARFIAFVRKHNALKNAYAEIVGGSPSLPAASDITEQDYQKIIERLSAENLQILSQTSRTISDMSDYYTLWAHQIKTPIAAMRLLLQSETRFDNSTLLSELFKTEQYVNMVLCYIRSESVSTDYVLKKCSLEKAARQAVRKYAAQFVTSKLALSFEVSDALVLTDEKWLVFVLEQLLSNAIKYTKIGTIRIAGDANSLTIEDSGIGIAAEDLPRVFEKGYTGLGGHASSRSTGIGLYLCSKVLRNLGHGIRIESDVGQGTKVTIMFDTEKRTFE